MLLALGTLLLMQVAFFVCNLRIFHLDGWNEWMGVLWGNIVFGVATIGAFFAPYLVMMMLPLTRLRWRRWYRTIAEVLYIVPMMLLLIPRGCNTAYYQFTYRLLSDEIFSYFGIGGQMGTLAPLFITDYWYAWLIPLLLFIAFLVVNSRIRLKVRNPYNKHLVNDIVGFVFGMAVTTGMILCVKDTSDAARYCQPKNSALVNNDAYNIMRTLFTPELSEVDYMSETEATQLMEPIFTPAPIDPDSTADSHPKRNIIIIVVEGLGQEYMGCYNTDSTADTRTPFLDSLAQHCTLYDGRANGKKSIEGITAINTGIPNLMAQPLTNSKYGSNDITGLPAILKRQGYRTGFYHGSYNGVMDFDKVCARIGFDEYHGKNEYDSAARALGKDPAGDYDRAWGIFDEEFLQYSAEQLNATDTPFFAEIFTVTSHHPYPIPDKYKNRFVGGSHPILKCFEYTDYALRRFFEEAQKQPWYDNTLFIITGDHSAQGLSREYNDYDGWYRIPMMVYDPQNPVGSRNPRIVQQIDIMPTLVDWLGIDEQFVCFGKSVFETPKVGANIYFGNGFHCLVCNDISNPAHHNIAVIQGSHEVGDPLQLLYLKAFIQQYNNRVINNKLTIKR